MQVQVKSSVFRPVTITIDTVEELRAVAAAIGITSHNQRREFSNDMYEGDCEDIVELYSQLNDMLVLNRYK